MDDKELHGIHDHRDNGNENSEQAYGPSRPIHGDAQDFNGSMESAATPRKTDGDTVNPVKEEKRERDRSERSDRDRDRKDRDRSDRDRDRHRDRDRDRDKDRERDKDRDRSDRDRGRDKDKDKERHRSKSPRERERERDRSPDRKRSRTDRSRSPDRPKRERARSPASKTLPLDKRPRRINLWDFPPAGCEGMTSQQVKALGVFPTPGAPSGPGAHGGHQLPGSFSHPMAPVISVLPSPQISQLNLRPSLALAASASMLAEANSNAARQARRIYVGNIPFGANEQELTNFFNQALVAAGANITPGNPVIMTQVNHDKNFAFLEFRTPEEATKTLAFDGITYQNTSLKLKRPKDYQTPLPSMSLESPFKISVNNIPSFFNEEQVKELLSAFGTLKLFNLVKDPVTGESKGSATCEFADPSVTDLAVQGLDGMEIAGSKLQVQRVALSLSSSFALPMGHAEATHVLQLLNMVTEEELVDDEEFEDIFEDVKEECRKFGAVKSLAIPRPIKGEKVPGLGKIFVEFEDVHGCASAFAALAGRKFASRTVVTSYYSEEKYHNRDFE